MCFTFNDSRTLVVSSRSLAMERSYSNGVPLLQREIVCISISSPTDTTSVGLNALINAASIAGMLLTTECVVADKPKKEEPVHAHGGAPDMGGMGY